MRQPLGPDGGSGGDADRLDSLTADLVRATGASVSLLFLLPPGERILWLALVSGASPELAAPWARVPMNLSTPVVDSIRRRRLVWVDSQEEMARRYPQLGLVVPYDFMLAASSLRTDDAVWGGVALLWPMWHPSHLSPSEEEAIDTFCRHATALLEQAAARGRPLLPPDVPRLLTAPKQDADPGQAMAALRFTARLPTGCCALGLDGRVTFINAVGADLLGAGAATLVGHRPWEVLRWLHDAAFEDSYRSAVITRRPTSFTALRTPDTPLFFQIYPGEDGLSVHIGLAGHHDFTAPGKTVPSGEPAGAVALYHLTHLAAVLAEAVGVDDVVDLVADQIVPAFGPQGLVLLIAEEGRLRIIGSRGYSDGFLNRFDGMPLAARAPTARTWATGAPSFFSTFADFQRAYPEATRYRNRSSWAFLPLVSSGRRIGSLVLSYDRLQTFPPAERAILTSLAGLLAQALDRAHLYDAEHALVRTLQTSLLPHALPRIPGLDVTVRYVPADQGMDIGGDFYDLIQGASITAAIGDVQGHNPTAAALMGQVRIAVHAHATTDAPPGELLSRTNNLLIDLDTGLFTSCLIAQLDPVRRRALLASAGHLPPLLRHPGGRTEVLHVTPGLPLGIEPATDYPTTEIALPAGAVLALYTDGLVEIPGTDIDDSIDALAQRLAQARSEDLDELADELIHHAEGSPAHRDDVALLLIRLQPKND
jgi:PAS domain-containing protein